MPKRKCNFVLFKKSVFHRHTLFPSMTDLLYCVCFHSTPESTIAIKHQHQLLGKTRNTRQPSKGLSFSRRLASKTGSIVGQRNNFLSSWHQTLMHHLHLSWNFVVHVLPLLHKLHVRGKSIEVFILCIKDVRLLHQHNFDEISFGLGKGKDEDDDG